MHMHLWTAYKQYFLTNQNVVKIVNNSDYEINKGHEILVTWFSVTTKWKK